MNGQQRVAHLVTLMAIAVPVSFPPPAAATSAAEVRDHRIARHAVVELLDRMPLLFVPEQVSSDGAMRYAVRGKEASVWLGPSGLSYRLHPASGSFSMASSWVVALDLVGATPRQPVGEDLLPTKVSYFKGPKNEWRTGLPSYGSVVYREPWPGVGLVVSGTAGELKSTFVVKPGANPGAIRLAYRGASAVRLEPDGSLAVDTPLGEIRERAPIAYQEVDGRRVEVAAAFELEPDGEPGHQAYRFRLGEHDPRHELVVDPVTLVYCGYIGGSHYDGGQDIAVDASGNAYVTGTTSSYGDDTFPVSVGPDLTHNGSADAFVARINADGSALGYCGYIGGSDDDSGNGIAVDAAGNAYVTGHSASNEASFPVSVGPDLSYNGNGDAFIAKVNADGSALAYCGYIGGEVDDYGSDIAIDAAGNAYAAGYTFSSEATFPVTVGPDLSYNDFPPNGPDAFVAKVNAAGTALAYCGYVGGSSADTAAGIAVDASGNTFIVGQTDNTDETFPVTVGPDLTHNGLVDAFVARVDAAGTALDYCGYIGGEFDDSARGIAVDAAGNVYAAGYTFSTEATFPVTVGPDLTHNDVGYHDAFVAKVNAAGTALAYCGFIGGSDNDIGYGIDIDAAGNSYVTGTSNSDDLPVTLGPDPTHNGNADAFVARVNAAGTALDYCGYVGGQFDDSAASIAVDTAGDAYVTGHTYSTEASFPVTVGPDLSFNGGYHDAFVAKVSGFLFGDGFESGDTTAWSATVP